jgi:hypothetical protein
MIGMEGLIVDHRNGCGWSESFISAFSTLTIVAVRPPGMHPVSISPLIIIQ